MVNKSKTTLSKKIGSVRVAGMWMDGTGRYQNLLSFDIGDVKVYSFAEDWESLTDAFIGMRRFRSELIADGLRAAFVGVVPMDVRFSGDNNFVVKPMVLEV